MDTLFEKKNIRVAVVGRNLDDLFPLLRLFHITLVDSDPELVISYGGDGSLLGAERQFPGIPKCPIRDTKQNPKCPLHAELSILEKLFKGQLKKTHLIRLCAETDDGRTLTGINDIVLAQTSVFSAIRYRIWLDGELFRGQIIADSLIVSTPFGSTGYFQSITHGNIQTGIGLAFNNSIDLYNHTVIATNTNIAIQILRGPAILVTDNNPTVIDLKTDDVFRIKALEDTTDIYGVNTFRCADCYNLRRNGI